MIFLEMGNTACEKAVEKLKEFHCDTRIVAGKGALAALKELSPKKLLLVSDPFFVKNGTAQHLLSCSGAEQTEIFDRVTPDPAVELAAEGTARVKDFGPDVLVALGGGSAMDCAKAMHYFAGGTATLVAVPTTSGSGSEVTDFAILTHGSVKHPLVDRCLRPKLAILEEELLMELPPALVAEGGFDAISHALEALVAKNATPITDALARDAFCTLYSLLPASFNGDKSVRLRLHMAATMAAMAFNQAGLGLCHAMAHSLGGRYHVAHGRLGAILLPSVIDCNAYVASGKYASLARAAGLPGSADTVAVRNLKNALQRLRREMGLPQTLAQAGIAPQRVWQEQGEIVAAAVADPCCRQNPIGVEPFMVQKVLEEVMGRV